MSYLALYRKYRPTGFDKLIGQEHIVRILTNQIENDRLGHAYLFTGTRGTGKTSCAKIFAKAINCLHPVNGSPCGECESCRALADPSNIDIIEIDAASNNGVNEIRDLREKVQYPPVSCKFKVYIIDEVHMLTGAAFNALLKTLEEPPKHAVFILATTEVHKIPATILSRCMRFDFRLVSTDRIAKLISDIYDEQGKEYEQEAVFAIAKAGEGSVRDALSIADTAISYSDDKLCYDQVNEILGSLNSDVLNSFIINMLNGNSGEIILQIDKLCALGKSVGVINKDVIKALRDLLVCKTCQNANSVLGLPKIKFDKFNEISNSVSEQRLLRCLEIFTQAESDLKYTTRPRIVFETASIKASKPDADYNIDALLSRIKALEDKINSGNFGTVAISTENVSVSEKAETPSKPEQQREGLSFDRFGESELKGKLLMALRKGGNEMLWNIMQSVNVVGKGNNLTLIPQNEEDTEILKRDVNKDRIFGALDDFMPFNLEIKSPESTAKLNAMDDATEKIKKIFGDDVVVVKH